MLSLHCVAPTPPWKLCKTIAFCPSIQQFATQFREPWFGRKAKTPCCWCIHGLDAASWEMRRPRCRQPEHGGKTRGFSGAGELAWPRLRKPRGFKKRTLLRQHTHGRVLCLGRTSVPGHDSTLLTVNMGEFCGRTFESAERDTVLSFFPGFVPSSLTDSLNKQLRAERNFGPASGQDQPTQR